MRFIHLLFTSPALRHPISQTRRTYSITLDLAVPQSLDYLTISSATNGVDTIELRVDSLRRPYLPLSSPAVTPYANPGCPDPSFVAFAIAHLRKISRLPIVYTIRTVRQGGSFVLEDSTREAYINLAIAAFRLGAEFLDLELELGESIIKPILACRSSYTQIVISHIDYTHMLRWTMPETMSLYEQCVRAGADIAKLSLHAAAVDDNVKLHNFLRRFHTSTSDSIPLIATNTGKNGKMSSLFNTFLTPVCHLYLPSPSILGQSTFANIQRALLAVGLTQHRRIGYNRNVSGEMQDFLDHKAILAYGCDILALPFTIDNDGEDHLDESFGGALTSVALDGALSTGKVSPAARWTGHIDTISASYPAPSLTYSSFPLVQNAPTYHNIRSLAIAEVVELGLSPLNTVTASSVAVLVNGRNRRGREAYYALKLLGISQVYCYDCDASLYDPAIRTVHINSPDVFAIPLEHFPTIILSFSSGLPSSPGCSFSPRLFASPTGGTLLELDTLDQPPTAFKRLIEESRSRDGWVLLSYPAVEIVAVKKEFEVLTYHRLPTEALPDQKAGQPESLLM